MKPSYSFLLSEIESNEERVCHRFAATLVSRFQKLKQQHSGEWWLAAQEAEGRGSGSEWWLVPPQAEETQSVNGIRLQSLLAICYLASVGLNRKSEYVRITRPDSCLAHPLCF